MKKISDVFKSIRFAKLDPEHDKPHSGGSTDDEMHYTVGEKEFEQQVKHVKKRAMQEETHTPPIAVRSLYTKMYAKHGGTASKAKDAQSKAYSEVEKKHGKEMRDSLEAFHKKNMNEAVKDKFDIGEYDQEGDMAKSDLRSILANAKRVHDMLEDDDNLPEWVQAKITKAEDYMSTVANYMEAEMNEEVEHHIIKSTHEKDDETGKPLYWNNNDGWGHKKYATKFSSKEKQSYRHIPMNSQWEKHVKEEVEELDELTKSTLGSYVKKASDSAAKSAAGSTSWAFRSTAAKNPRVKAAAEKYSDEDEAKKQKRLAGVTKAVNRLSKEEVELDEENKPTNPELWARAKSMAKSKFDVYPSAYANGWAAKWYKSKGGGWRSVNEENYEVTVMHTTKDGEKGEHTHKVMNADDARHAKNIALQKHEKMLNNKGVEVRGMGTTTAKVVEEGSAYDRINARFKKLSGKSLEDTAKYHKAESEKLAKEIKDQEEKNKKMKSEAVKNDDLPFTPDKPKKKDIIAGKYGAGYSTAKSLAKQAMKKQMEKMKKPIKEEMSKKAKIVKDIMKNKNSDKFESDPIISKTVDDKES